MQQLLEFRSICQLFEAAPVLRPLRLRSISPGASFNSSRLPLGVWIVRVDLYEFALRLRLIEAGYRWQVLQLVMSKGVRK